jgi:MOSC domain-containing protein YiiM
MQNQQCELRSAFQEGTSVLHPTVLAIAASARHKFSKVPALQISLIAGLGVLGDAHAGATVKHRSRVAKDPTVPNMRQVHLIHVELFDELAQRGFSITPGDLGENITTRGIDLLKLSAGTILRIGPQAALRITGLRNPCRQIDKFQRGLMAATLARDTAGNLIRKAGIMSVVLASGDVAPGDTIQIETPPGPHQPLAVV